jgi:hypothetical protein
MNEFHSETVLHQMQDDDLIAARAADGADRFHIGVSAQVGELFSALAKCQAEIQNPQRNAENPFFKSSYADLTSIWDVVREPLTKNGLSIAQFPGREGNEVLLTTVLAHESGQYIISRMAMTPEKDNPHGQASCITYMRRFALAAATGCAPAGDDDDGNSAVQPPQHQTTHVPPAPEQNGNGKRGRKSNAEKLRERLKKLGVGTKEDADLIVWYSTAGEVLTIEEAKLTAKKASRALDAINSLLVVEGYTAGNLLEDAKAKFEGTHDLEAWVEDEAESTDAMINGPRPLEP